MIQNRISIDYTDSVQDSNLYRFFIERAALNFAVIFRCDIYLGIMIRTQISDPWAPQGSADPIPGVPRDQLIRSLGISGIGLRSLIRIGAMNRLAARTSTLSRELAQRRRRDDLEDVGHAKDATFFSSAPNANIPAARHAAQP